MTVTARRAQAGFTLIEVMMALAILAFMMTIAWSTTSRSATTKREVEHVEQRNHAVRVAMSRMVQDLSHAYLSANERERGDRERTLFVGERSSPISEIRFSSLAHQVLWADANESEQTMITYFAESDPDDASKTNLLRRELRRLPDSERRWQDVPAQVDLMLRDIESLELEYYDWRDEEWQKEWDSTAADGERGRLPTRVRITLTLTSRGGDDIRISTQARIPLQEELKLFAN